MGRLSPIQIATTLRGAGFPERDISRMTAAALAESGGNPRAHNPNASTGDNSYGLLQVNMLGGMGDQRRRELGLGSNEELFDPATNARAALHIYKSQGPGAWSVIRSGDYKKYLPEVEQALRTLPPGAPPATRSAIPQAPAPAPAPAEADDFTQSILKGLFGGGALAATNSPRNSSPPAEALGLESGPKLLPVLGGKRSAVPALIGGGGVFDYLARAIKGDAPREAMSNGAPLAGGGVFSGLMNAILNPSKMGASMEIPTPPPTAPTQIARASNAPSIKGYRQGGWGPRGATQYGDHFDIAAVDGSYFDRNALDKYVLVNGKPLSKTVTVAGGQFGASRDGGKRVHTAWDFADEPGAVLTLGGGAGWLDNRKSDYGDRAEFQTPDGKRYRLIHGTIVPGG